MASARSGNSRTTNDLLRFNIRVEDVPTASFFETTDLPAPPASETILNNLEEPNGPLSNTDRKFFQYLQMAVSDESAVHDFVAFLLKSLGYDHDDRLLRSNREMSFYMAGQLIKVKADMALMDGTFHLLLVQERVLSCKDLEPQLIAKAIAAFSMNNHLRSESGLLPLTTQDIPGIIMVGTAPIFYRITVTTALIDALAASTYPAESTIVLKCIPPVPNPVNYSVQGMRPLENRRVVLQCFEAFKVVILSHLHPRDSEILAP